MTDVATVQGGPQNPALAQVTTDGLSLHGNGTTQLPLGTGLLRIAPANIEGGQVSFGNSDKTAATALLAGMPVYVSGATLVKAKNDSAAHATVVGLVPQAIANGAKAGYLAQGPLRLPTAAWDAITGGSGGLTPGAAYFVSATDGHITASAPGTFNTQVGVAISSTEMNVRPSYPVAG